MSPIQTRRLRFELSIYGTVYKCFWHYHLKEFSWLCIAYSYPELLHDTAAAEFDLHYETHYANDDDDDDGDGNDGDDDDDVYVEDAAWYDPDQSTGQWTRGCTARLCSANRASH